MKTLFQTPFPYFMADGDGGGGGQGDGQGVDQGVDKQVDQAAADKAAADQGKEQQQLNDQGKDDGRSFLDGADKLDDKKQTVPADWPEDWRDKMAAGDKELRKRLDRFAAPADVFKSYVNLEGRFKKGGGASLDEPMPDPEKEPEAAKEWRKARGIPDDPTGYKVPDEVAKLVKDEDKPRLGQFTEAMHKAGVPQQYAGAAMQWYFQEQEAASQAIAEADKADKAEVEEKLREEWGPDFRANSTVAKRFAEEITPGINWFEARLPDGRLLGSVPEFVKKLTHLGLQEYGDVTFAGREAADRTSNRMKELERIMREEPDKYTSELSKEYEKLMEGEVRRQAARGSQHTPDREQA